MKSIEEVDSVYWFNDERDRPTVRNVADHARLIGEADLAYPIILDVDGHVMDGMHRVAKAVLEGRATIAAVQFETHPKPDYVNCRPEDLAY